MWLTDSCVSPVVCARQLGVFSADRPADKATSNGDMMGMLYKS